MQTFLMSILDPPKDFSRQKVLVGLSGGINSAAALCYLGKYHPENLKPLELHLFYSHLKEHSPKTFRFVADQIRYARRKFQNVKAEVTRDSLNKFFIEQKMIPHPTISPCSWKLKIEPRARYISEHGIDLEMVGFVREDTSRWRRQQQYNDGRTLYPILHLSDEDCFWLVKQEIGWYPPIYDIKKNGKRVFKHNNCLPCKNMTRSQLESVCEHFPEYAKRAQETADQIPGGYWGRDDVPEVFRCDACERF